jgi:hypothetical protein
MLDFDAIRTSFHVRGKDQEVEEYETTYRNLLERVRTTCMASPVGDFGDNKRIREYSLLLSQVLLHRSIKLFEGSLSALVADNVYTMTLAIRGHFETTGALGYLQKRLQSLSQGVIGPAVVDQDICAQLLGGRDGGVPQAPEAKQVMNLLKHADKTICKTIFHSTSTKHVILTDCYKYLCEFSHPNYHSNSVSFDLDKNNKLFTIRHNLPMRDIEFNLIEYLLLSSDIFINLFDIVTYSKGDS